MILKESGFRNGLRVAVQATQMTCEFKTYIDKGNCEPVDNIGGFS